MNPKTWFITGTSRGFGYEWALAALDRGDRVVATARDARTLDPLVHAYGEAVLPISLDVVDRGRVFEAVARGREHFGRLDVVVNNAGYGQFGMIEELSEDECREQIEVNFFGALWVTQAVLPVLRKQRDGHLLQVSSIGGVCAFPTVGIYHASKWALEGMSQSVAQEVADFGIKVTIIEPGSYSTDWSGSSARHARPIDVYDHVREQAADRPSRRGLPGDPAATRQAILKLVDSPHPPLRAFFGEAPLAIATAEYEDRLATWNEWQHLARSAHGTT